MNESLLTLSLSLLLFALVFIPYLWFTQKKRKTFEAKKQEAIALGHDKPVAQHPLIDQSRCIGCAACVIACPEHALGMIDGMAELVYPGKCVGHGVCAEACPVSGIRIVLDPAKSTAELPLLDEFFQSNVPNVYLIGELGGMALLRNAIYQGKSVIEHISEKIKSSPRQTNNPSRHDVIIIGAGPAGLSAALMAQKNGLNYLLLEKEETPGGAILSYPRQKLVMTMPVEIPQYGVLKKRELSKEDLLTLWSDIIQKTSLKVTCNERLEDVIHHEGALTVVTSGGNRYDAEHVVLALGRRGTPRKLNVPGEQSSKVAYQLLEAVRYKHMHCMVVGAGDSGIEAAIALSKQHGTTVTLINRGTDFQRAKSKNQDRVREAETQNLIKIYYQSSVSDIRDHSITIQSPEGSLEITNDFIFIFAGGEMPTPFLKKIGIEFTHKDRMIAA
ncbi:NAD(P)-binding domain-containing protein [bacterium]|nr:NAD(P)-binding domain-containing protein [bacterium]